MKTKTYERATARICIRLRPSEKKKMLESIKEDGFANISVYVIHLLNNKPVKDFKAYKEFITALHLISFEINRIGVNINQVAHLMHQDKLIEGLSPTTLQQFNNYVKGYNQLLEELKSLFEKIITHEQAGI